MCNISNTDHVVDNRTIGIPVMGRVNIERDCIPSCNGNDGAMRSVYKEIAKLVIRLAETERKLAAIEGKLERIEEKRSIYASLRPETHEY